jgi:hypothetical protein
LEKCLQNELKATFDKAFAAYESWKTEAERLQERLDELRADGIEFDPGFVVDGVIDTLRNDPRMPKLSRFEYEQMLGDHYRSETIDISDDIGDDDDEDEPPAEPEAACARREEAPA